MSWDACAARSGGAVCLKPKDHPGEPHRGPDGQGHEHCWRNDPPEADDALPCEQQPDAPQPRAAHTLAVDYMLERDAALATASAAEARHQRQLRDLLTLLQGAHGALPDGDVPRAAVDGLVAMAEAYLLRALKGGAQ